MLVQQPSSRGSCREYKQYHSHITYRAHKATSFQAERVNGDAVNSATTTQQHHPGDELEVARDGGVHISKVFTALPEGGVGRVRHHKQRKRCCGQSRWQAATVKGTDASAQPPGLSCAWARVALWFYLFVYVLLSNRTIPSLR